MGTSKFSDRVKSIVKNFTSPTADFEMHDVMQDENPVYNHFRQISKTREELLNKHSVSAVTTTDQILNSFFSKESGYHVFVYNSLPQEKMSRIQEYRRMACYPEIKNAIEEYANGFIVDDDNDQFCNITFDNEDLTEDQLQVLRKEFKKILNMFDFKTNGFAYCKQYLTEAELFFENVVHKDHKDVGIVGIKMMHTELCDPIYNNAINEELQGFVLRKPIIDENEPSKIKEYQFIPLERNQVTYVHSSTWNETKRYRVPFLENAREAYRRLSLLEDSIVIYRLVRAPEKLVFNIDVGTASPAEAEAMLRNHRDSYWSRKSFDSKDGVQKFNPQSMLDAFWFPKRKGAEGSSVTTLAGGQNLGQLDDLNYFQRKLYESLNVPTSRLNKESQANVNDATIQREELAFCSAIMRIQNSFAQAIKRTFISHLKLRGIYQRFEMKETDITIKFNAPSTYYLMRQQQVLSIKMDNFSAAINTQAVSITYAQKKYLEWTDTEIKANREGQRRDAELMWELEQIKSSGPNWRATYAKQQIAGEEGASAAAGEAMGMPPMGGGGGAAPDASGGPGAVPDFGDPGAGSTSPAGPAEGGAPEGSEAPPGPQ